MKTLAVLLVALLASSSLAKETEENEVVQEEKSTEPEQRLEHPCSLKACGQGYECDLDEEDTPICICTRKCTPEISNVQVCTTQNITVESECEYFRQKCLCSHQNAECSDLQFASAHLDYFGPCKDLPACQEDEMAEFPKRMRDWLYLIMKELDERSDLKPGAHQLLEEAKSHHHHWVLPVIWKFCDLDLSKDRFVNTDELLSITAPLKPLEHCTGPFLEKCDVDNNGQIDLVEWGVCLGLEEGDIEDRCDMLYE